jgi:glyoxylase-like metal-dependent hydrolase (beta-lactamase superfamily II)
VVPIGAKIKRMIRVTDYGSVTRFDLCRAFPGGWRYWTTAYLIDGMLIDTGCAHTASELVRVLDGTNIDLIANTHSHEDHIGANGWLQRQRTGLEILAHPLALPILADPRRKQRLHPYRWLFWGWPEPCDAKPVEIGTSIETKHHCFQVLYTPGHSRDHLCLYEPTQGWLFSGDLFVGGQEKALRGNCDIWQIIASLKQIAALPIAWLYPGCAKVRQDPKTELEAKIDYLEAFGGRVLELNQNGKSPREITRDLCGRPMAIELITLGHFTRKRLVLSYLGLNNY